MSRYKPYVIRAPQWVPARSDWPDAGVYQLHIRIVRPLDISIGRLGRMELPPGRYVYTGRASRGLITRVQRHIRRNKRCHWHIDYLLASRGVRLERVVLVAEDPGQECACNRRIAGAAIAPGFGASDCHEGCAAHLIRRTSERLRVVGADVLAIHEGAS